MPEDFKEIFKSNRRDGKCSVHKVPLLEHSKFRNKKTGLLYCPKCRDEAMKQENERNKLSE